MCEKWEKRLRGALAARRATKDLVAIAVVWVQVPSSALVRKSLKTLIYKDLRDFFS